MRPLALVGVLLASLIAAAPAAADDAYSGQLEIRHSDDFARGATSTRYMLERPGGRPLAVRPTLPPDVRSGSRVIVRGKKRGRIVRGDIKARPGVRAAAATLGLYKTAVLLVNFADDRSEPWTPAYVRNRFFNDPDSIDTFFKEQSWNQVDLTGDVYGWYQLSANGAGCDVDAWAKQADDQAIAAGVPLSSFNSVVYVFPDQADCSWAGLAEMPGSHAWLNGDISVRVASHELGHNMGVHHAAALSCSNNGVAVAISSTCSLSEYGDPFSTMGNAARRMAGWHLQQLGYMQAANVQTVTTNGTYTIQSTLNPSPQPQLLKIPKTPATNPAQYYYVDLRAAGGVFDNFGISDPAVKGATIRIGNAPTVRNQSRLIDTTPDSYSNSAQDFIDAPLAPGRTFSDGTVSISTVSISGGAATVEVNWNSTPPDTEAPSAPVITGATNYGSYVDLGWSASSDNVGVSGYRVKRNGSTIATVGAGTLTYRDSNVYSGWSYNYCVEAFDAVGNVRSSTCVTPAAYAPPTDSGTTVPPTGGDSTTTTPRRDVTPPAISVIAPGRNARLRRKATVRAGATDAAGVQIIEFWVDNVRLATRRGGSLNLTWNLRRVTPGRHTIAVIARDASGNAARRNVAVRVRR